MRSRSEIAADFRLFGGTSPLYSALNAAAAADAAAGGPAWEAISEHAHLPVETAVPLRLAGAVHRLVLEGKAPELAAHYPSAGGKPQRETPRLYLDTIAAHMDEIRVLMSRPVQTNEVGRCAALIGGFLLVARAFGLPLRILELGASAGLNLNWDRYRYEARAQTWGPESSPVRLCTYNSDRALPFDVEARIAERRGCDTNPIDSASDDSRLTLLSFVWPDQLHRIRTLNAALDVARRHPATVDAADALTWLRPRLHEPGPGMATVVYHSVFMPYVPPESREELREAIEEAGRRATGNQPLAWLRMEPDETVADVRLTMWPGGREQRIARSGYHGEAVSWLV